MRVFVARGVVTSSEVAFSSFASALVKCVFDLLDLSLLSTWFILEETH